MENATIINIPKTRDPFVNVQLVPAGIEKNTGEERFWASTWNSNSGSTGALVNISGESKIFKFDHEKKQFGYYGASYAENDIMWLSCFLDEISMLDLNSGKITKWDTGLPHALSLSGMVHDEATKKVFSAGYCQVDFKRKAFSFNTKSQLVESKYDDLALKNNQLRYSIKNNDGTYTFVYMIPDVELLLWDPVKETVEVITENFKVEEYKYYLTIIKREDGAIYLPQIGWFDPNLRKFVEGPKASREASWFAIKDNIAYGAEYSTNGNSTLYKWDILTGNIKFITEIPDASPASFKLSSNGKIVCLNMYGFFYRINTDTFAIEHSSRIDSDSIGAIDCLYRISEERLLCTPFITQRFYEIDLKSGKGYDLGRATGGSGEVLEIEELNGKIYMASYTKGQLVEYDPKLPAYFPENPRLVVQPPRNTMRPVAMCTDGKSIYYSCSHEYGYLGSILIKYTPSKGCTLFKDNIIENQMICSMVYNKEIENLVVGTTIHADCRTCVPKAQQSVIAKLNPKSLEIKAIIEAPHNCEKVEIIGKLNKKEYICCFIKEDGKKSLAVFDIVEFNYRIFKINEIDINENKNWIYYTGTQGIFVVTNGEGIELWNLNDLTKLKDICRAKGYSRIFIQNNELYIVYRKEIHIYNGIQ